MVGDIEEVDYLTAENAQSADCLMQTCLNLIANSASNDESVQMCSYLISIITCVFVGLQNDAKDAIRSLGGNPTTRVLPRDYNLCRIELATQADPLKCLIHFAQAILIIFKTISPASYTNYIANKAIALKAILDLAPFDVALESFNIDKASILWARVGACYAFKAAIVKQVIAYSNNDTSIGKVCAYLLTILAWTDMSEMVLITDTLLATRSPVIRDPRVGREVRNLVVAFNKINKFEYPQFYRIMKPPGECRILERSRFTILFAIATKLRAQSITTLRDNSLVDTLLEIHRQSRTPASQHQAEFQTRSMPT